MRRALVAVVVVAAGLAAVALAVDGGGRSRDTGPRFRVDGTVIRGPDGETPFVPIGMNLLGPDAFFNADGVTAGHARVLADTWGVNAVRLNACLPVGCPYTGVHNERNDDLDALVEEYTDAGLVVIVAQHQVEPGSWPDEATAAALEAWWADVARRHGDNPYVWLNLVNEPGSDRPADRRWLELHRRLVTAVRGTGARNLLVVDGTQWGQEAGTREPTPVRDADSALLRFGRDLLAVDDQIVFSLHVYDQWGPPGSSDDGRDARLADFVGRVHEAGLALLIGETGSPEGPEGDERSLAVASAYRVAPRLGVGILAWHGQGVDGFGLVDTADERSSPSALDDRLRPTNLTWHGELLWRLAHGR